MNLDTANLKTANAIAYDKPLRDYLKELRNTLSEGLMDISVSAMKQGTEYKFKAIEQLKFMSGLTSELSVALIKAKGEKKLDTQEQEQFDSIKELTNTLGNLQFSLNSIIMDFNKMEKLGDKISKEGEDLMNSVVDVQAKLMTIRADINDLGFFSKNSELAHLFDEQNSSQL